MNKFSFHSAIVQTFFDEHLVDTATGSLWSHRKQFYLISNWHVISGRNPSNGQPMHREGGILPNRISLTYWVNGEEGKFEMQQRTFTYGPDQCLQHRIFGRKFDIAAVPIDLDEFSNNGSHPCCLSARTADLGIGLSVTQDVFVVGFPGYDFYTGAVPIWKRGTIASEPNISLNGLPCYLIDTATRGGMSGSPVYARFETEITLQGGFRIRPNGAGPFFELVGIYSSRLIGQAGEFHLGRVWKPSAILEMLEDPGPGRFGLDDD